MADTVKTSKTVSMIAEFSDGDTRTLTQSDPLTNQSSLITAINDFDTYCRTNQIIIGDKASGSYTGIREAKVINKTTTNFDLTQRDE